MVWLLCDYGEVLSLPQPDADRRLIEQAAKSDGPRLWPDYWANRPAYDRGDLTREQYWAAVLGYHPSSAQLESLLSADISSWLHPNESCLAAALRASDRGLRLAVLSNAPVEVASAIDSQGWLSAFSPRIYSCMIRATKPEPAAYAAAVDLLGVTPSDIFFLDDRPANVSAAAEFGFRAAVFSGPAQIDSLLT